MPNTVDIVNNLQNDADQAKDGLNFLWNKIKVMDAEAKQMKNRLEELEKRQGIKPPADIEVSMSGAEYVPLVEKRRKDKYGLYPLSTTSENILANVEAQMIVSSEVPIKRTYVYDTNNGILKFRELSPFDNKVFNGEVGVYNKWIDGQTTIWVQTETTNPARDLNHFNNLRQNMHKVCSCKHRKNIRPTNVKYWEISMDNGKLVFYQAEPSLVDEMEEYFIEYDNRPNTFVYCINTKDKKVFDVAEKPAREAKTQERQPKPEYKKQEKKWNGYREQKQVNVNEAASSQPKYKPKNAPNKQVNKGTWKKYNNRPAEKQQPQWDGKVPSDFGNYKGRNWLPYHLRPKVIAAQKAGKPYAKPTGSQGVSKPNRK